MKLVIVESPSKAKTIEKYLGKDYAVDASGGHVRDLPEKTLAVDIANNFKPKYALLEGKSAVIKRLKEKADKSEQVYLATDPDREGEAISWHLQHLLNLDPKQKNRITFNEISKNAVTAAIEKPDGINLQLVNAQQARRVLDRLVGYTLSPVLCKRIQPKLSAGRVQSATLKLIVDREREIEAFVPQEYWNVTANLEKPKNPPRFKCLLSTYLDKKLKITNKEQCGVVLSNINGGEYVVTSVKSSVIETGPYAPFTTSTMQQEAVNKLKMSSGKCMMLAQQLYEGIDAKGISTAYVTYIRTDSVRVSPDAHAAARDYIAANFGKQYIPAKPNYFSSKKSAQDAHEAIRPINVEITPQSVKDILNKEQYSLYKLIYDRFLASCAAKSRHNSVSVNVDCNGYGFKASGKTLLFDGFLHFYDYVAAAKEEGEDTKLPALAEGDKLKLIELASEQKFTKPPSRYTEAGIIKVMEENGIGRPSTYANTIYTLSARKYTERENKALKPTELGKAVTCYLEDKFPDIINVAFTAKMEDKLDLIEEDASIEWQEVVKNYYQPLSESVKRALGDKEIVALGDEPEFIDCASCGGKGTMQLKVGRYGKYYNCSVCKTNQSLKKLAKAAPVETDILCEKCGKKMLIREGRSGKFLACSGFPQCKNTRSLEDSVALCPKCGGDIIKRRGKSGKIFYGCNNYPKCDFVSFDKPLNEKCPQCGAFLVEKTAKDKTYFLCSSRECKYKRENVNEA